MHISRRRVVRDSGTNCFAVIVHAPDRIRRAMLVMLLMLLLLVMLLLMMLLLLLIVRPSHAGDEV
jgi:hypothetical protein